MDTQRLSQTVQPLLDWYRGHARVLPWRADREPYHVWLSEIMLQQTRVEAVRGYYARFLAAAPDVFALAALPEAQLLKLWEGLGYYNRARKAQECARVIAARGGVWPDTVEGLLALPGIGPYTAGAIASICFERPAAAVDGNVLRVCARVLDDATPIDNAAHKTALTAALSACYPAGHCGDFTQALMELGATVCGPNRAPQCEACPIATLCLARAHGTAAALPVKAPKRAKRAEEHTVFCLRCGNRLAVERRPSSGDRTADCLPGSGSCRTRRGCSTSGRRVHSPADRGSATCGCAARATAGTSSHTSSGRCAATRSSARPCRRNTAGQRRTSCARRSPCRLRSGSFWMTNDKKPTLSAADRVGSFLCFQRQKSSFRSRYCGGRGYCMRRK